MIPEASRVMLKQWQAQGLKFNWLGSSGGDHLGFDSEIEDYEIVEQPIPEGLSLFDFFGMVEKSGIAVTLVDRTVPSGVDAERWLVNEVFRGSVQKHEVFIPAQPIPEKLLQEPITKKDIEQVYGEQENPYREESDPDGLDPHAPGAKLDAGKNRLGLVLGGFARALEEVGKVGTYGAEKYSPNGWKKVEDGSERYEDAMMRHWVEIKKGNAQDPKTGLLHQAHLAWNALAVLELMLKETK